MSTVCEVNPVHSYNFNAHRSAHRYERLVCRRGERQAGHEIAESKI